MHGAPGGLLQNGKPFDDKLWQWSGMPRHDAANWTDVRVSLGTDARHGPGAKGANRIDVRVRSGEGETGVLRVISWVELALVERAMACNWIDVRVWDRWHVGSLGEQWML